MAVIYGVTSTGFLAKPLSVTSAEIDTDLQAILGASAGTDADGTIPLASMAGQLKSMLVDIFQAQWDLQQAVYSSLDPNQTSAASQDVVGSITGAVRDAQSFSTVTATCTGKPGTILSAGRVVTVLVSNARFDSLVAGTLASLSAWVALTGYTVGQRVTNNNNCYICAISGTSAASGGPTTQVAGIVDGTVIWVFLGAGTAAADIAFEAEDSGPVGALAGTLTSIATPVSGWSGVTNLLDATTGSLQETDAAFRARRNLELAAAGNTTVEAIRANILAVNQGSTDPTKAPATSCTVFYNNTDYTDANGVPPHAIEVMIQGGMPDSDFALAVWQSVGGGTATYGNQTSVVTDSQGNPQTVYWTRPVAVPIYATIVGTYDASAWATDPNAQIDIQNLMISALLTFGSTFPIGSDVRSTQLISAVVRGPAAIDLVTGSPTIPAPATASAIAAMLDVVVTFGLASNPQFSTTVSIGTRQIATFDSSRTAAASFPGTP